MPNLTSKVSRNREARESAVAALSLPDLDRLAARWLDACDAKFHSERTIDSRRSMLEKLSWWLRQEERPECGARELEEFLAYVRHGHKSPGGRWGNERMTRAVRPRTVRDYHGHLRTFFRWCVQKGALDASPCEQVERPEARADQIQPFTRSEVSELLRAAAKTAHPKRDEAIALTLLDCGLRASELCGLTVADVDFSTCQLDVLGKGNKRRAVPFARSVKRALYNYLEEQKERREIEDDLPLFTSDRGRNGGVGEPLTRSGLQQLIERIARTAGVKDAHPHRFRHTMAVEYLRAGGQVFSLMRILGHTSLQMTNRYVALAQADIQAQHKQFSPADRLKRGVR